MFSLFTIKVYWIHSVVPISAIQRNGSYIWSFFLFFSIMVYPRRLDIVPPCYMVGPCCVSILNVIIVSYNPFHFCGISYTVFSWWSSWELYWSFGRTGFGIHSTYYVFFFSKSSCYFNSFAHLLVLSLFPISWNEHYIYIYICACVYI